MPEEKKNEFLNLIFVKLLQVIEEGSNMVRDKLGINFSQLKERKTTFILSKKNQKILITALIINKKKFKFPKPILMRILSMCYPPHATDDFLNFYYKIFGAYNHLFSYFYPLIIIPFDVHTDKTILYQKFVNLISFF